VIVLPKLPRIAPPARELISPPEFSVSVLEFKFRDAAFSNMSEFTVRSSESG